MTGVGRSGTAGLGVGLYLLGVGLFAVNEKNGWSRIMASASS